MNKKYLLLVLAAFMLFVAISPQVEAQTVKPGSHKGSKAFISKGKAAAAKPAEVKPNGGTGLPISPPKKKKKKIRKSLIREEEYRGSGLNFKLVPAFFWGAAGLEIEKPIGDNISLSLNTYYRIGSLDTKSPLEQSNPTNNNQYMVELQGKYYFNHAPRGFYAMAQMNFSNMLFADGTSRPFSAFGYTPPATTANVSPFVAPGVFRYGLGCGYQWILVPRHLVANICVGFQAYSENGTHINPYLTPSFGIIF